VIKFKRNHTREKYWDLHGKQLEAEAVAEDKVEVVDKDVVEALNRHM
jgi:hypothetical protein